MGLIPELHDHLQKLADRLGKLRMPVHAYIAGGMAVNFHTGIRMSDDVDIQWSHKVAIPPDLRVFPAINPDDPSDVILVTMDGEFGDYLGTFPPDWKEKSILIGEVGDLVLHVINPLDLATSKVGRYQERDREDIQALARAGLIDSESFSQRIDDALDYYVGDITFVQYNKRDAVELVEEIENERRQK
ncbi:hypothetical protein HOY34_21350 [Xinfangfangia sp. D13-10-4-6]|uniref:DUF6036 family nucleotidyltransferase n=1 Tax=Pseudogemmobacter hezensis TaxID=2737662 RepID=UPI0015534CCF|nr:DUF6036 family nucleotidyltransferase [Pseudogemmobacter hezensis]NPD17729.1 hypothetical protein [Pseudogemmobacter hezensis]